MKVAAVSDPVPDRHASVFCAAGVLRSGLPAASLHTCSGTDAIHVPVFAKQASRPVLFRSEVELSLESRPYRVCAGPILTTADAPLSAATGTLRMPRGLPSWPPGRSSSSWHSKLHSICTFLGTANAKQPATRSFLAVSSDSAQTASEVGIAASGPPGCRPLVP